MVAILVLLRYEHIIRMSDITDITGITVGPQVILCDMHLNFWQNINCLKEIESLTLDG